MSNISNRNEIMKRVMGVLGVNKRDKIRTT